MTEIYESLYETRALCPECMAVLPASLYADSQSKVWMTRTCPEHGETQTMVWPDVEHYQRFRSLAFPKVAPAVITETAKPCPTGCGICQRHKRKPTLVEVEVTQRCNLRCPVCFMSAESDNTDVPLEELRGFFEAVARTAGVETGLQITGGEPTVRKDLSDIVRMARDMGFWGIEVNTNGVVISRDLEYLQQLVASGLTGIYLQFDGVTAEPYRQIRGADLLETKLRAVENCRAAGVQVVLAMTIVSGINSDQIGAVIQYALDNSDVVAGVALQPAFTSGRFDTKRVVPLTMGDVVFMLEEQTDGLIRAEDLLPLGCSNPLCSSGTFMVESSVFDTEGASEHQESTFVPVTRGLSREEYLSLYNPDSPQGSVFLDIMENKGISTARGLSILIMNYMDVYTMDLDRLEECSMLVTMADGRLIPFCSYQLTDCSGERVYPPWGKEPHELSWGDAAMQKAEQGQSGDA